MHPAAGVRRCAVSLVALATLALGCGGSPKKKAAAAEETSHVDDDPAPRWESAGETMPPEKKAEKPPEKPTEKAPDKPDKPAQKAEKPGPKNATASKPPAPKPPAKKGAPPPKVAANKKGAPGSSAAGVNDEQLLQPVLTLDSVASSAPSPKATPPASPAPPPPVPPPAPPPAPKKTETVVARVDPPPPPPAPPPAPPPRVEPEPRDNLPPPKIERQRIDPSETSIASTSTSTSTSTASIDAARTRDRALEREIANMRELHAMIGGKPVVFRSGVVLGNKRTGYALQVFESPGSTSDGEMDANIEVDLDRHRDLEKRKLIPLKLIYLQIADPTGKSESGFRALECRGRGQIVFESMPPLPKRLPQEQADIGDTVANLALSATCTRDSAEFGSFVIEGRVVMRVLIIPADM